jgi:nitronate monooxygenase
MDLMARLGLRHPIIQAPMAGGSTPPGFIAVAIRLGLLGSLGAAYLAPAVIEAPVAESRAAAKGPLGINLFLPVGRPPAPGVVAAMIDFLAPRHAAAGIAPPALPDPPEQDFQAQLAALRRARPEVASFVFDCPDPAMVAALKAEGMVVIGGATTLDEARAVAAAGVDAVVTQGAEAGGHRASFLAPFEASLVPTLELVGAVAGALALPVIAAGGIATGADIKRMLDLGAAGVQMGSRFVATKECSASDAFKAMYVAATDADIVITKSPVGLPGRALRNPLTERLARADYPPIARCRACLKDCGKEYCIIDTLERAQQGDVNGGLVFAGTSAAQVHDVLAVAELMERLVAEWQAAEEGAAS